MFTGISPALLDYPWSHSFSVFSRWLSKHASHMYVRVLPHHTYSFKVSEKETQWKDGLCSQGYLYSNSDSGF